MQSPQRILLIRNDNIGDLVCTTPAIEALKRRYKDSQIDIVVNSYNACAIMGNPNINRVWVYTKSKHVKGILNKLKALFQKSVMLYRLRTQKYDVSVVFRIAYSGNAELFSRVANAKMRIGVASKKGEDSFTHRLEIQQNLHEVEVCYECLRPLGVESSGELPYWHINDELKERFNSHASKLFFHISSRLEANRIDSATFAELFSLLSPSKCVITASPDDSNLATELSRAENVEFVKTANLDELAALISHGALFVTLDGGALHLGSAVGVRTLAILGKTNPTRWRPWGRQNNYVMQPITPSELARLIMGMVQETSENLSIAQV
ncbi:MAG: glycosyltransferase family 9 protein [Wolinella sp.]